MPLYDYECEACNHRCEILLPYSKRDEPGPCPECGKDKLKKSITAPTYVYDTKTVLNRTSSGWKDHLQRIKDGSGKYGQNKNTIKTGRSQK